MNLFSLRTLTLLQKRLLLASLVAFPLGAACSADDAAPAAPIVVTLAFTGLDGSKTVIEPVPLRCDGTLAIDFSVTTAPTPDQFAIRPARACASSPHCGYIHVEALDADGTTLASVETATKGALLKIPIDQRAAVVELRASLLRGIDDAPVLNPDKTEVVASISPTFAPTPSEECPEIGAGGAGAGGESAGGAAGAAAGGAAGAANVPVTGGNGGEGNVAAGGAGAGGELALAGVAGI